MSSPKFSLALLVSASLFPLVSHAGPAYKIVFLPPGFFPVAINNAGQIAGNASVGNERHASLLSGGKLKDLGTLGGPSSTATALNEVGDVTGTSLTCGGAPHAFLYTRDRLFDIDRNGIASIGLGINTRREVVGQFRASAGYHPFLFSHNQLRDLGVLGEGSVSLATGINDAGLIVGESDIESSSVAPFHAFTYRNGVMKDLGHLDEVDRHSGAGAVNNAGQIAGYAERMGGARHLALFSKDGIRDLGTFGGLYLTAAAINARGMIVGTSDQYAGPTTGFLYANGKLASLGTLIDPASEWTVAEANGINDRGQIVGTACNTYYECRGVRLDPLKPLSQEGTGEDAELAAPGAEPDMEGVPAPVPEDEAEPERLQTADTDENNPPSNARCGGGGS